MCAHVGGPTKFEECWGPIPWDGGMADPPETHSSPTCVIVPNFIALGQTVWVYVGGPKNLGMLQAWPLGMWTRLTL